MARLYYYHDPMCSWCWGYRPVAEQVFANLPLGIVVENVLGGLAPDSDQPMGEEMRREIPENWKKIETLLGTEFNYDFWNKCEPRRSTYPACRAVIAAAEQDAEHTMINAIQRAYYLRAMNPSDVSTLQALASELKLDGERFRRDLASEKVETELQRQVQFSWISPIKGFPSLALEHNGELVPVNQDYQNARITLDHLDTLL